LWKYTANYQTERDKLLEYFDRHPNLHVNWITVNDDVLKASGVENPHPP